MSTLMRQQLTTSPPITASTMSTTFPALLRDGGAAPGTTAIGAEVATGGLGSTGAVVGTGPVHPVLELGAGEGVEVLPNIIDAPPGGSVGDGRGSIGVAIAI